MKEKMRDRMSTLHLLIWETVTWWPDEAPAKRRFMWSKKVKGYEAELYDLHDYLENLAIEEEAGLLD